VSAHAWIDPVVTRRGWTVSDGPRRGVTTIRGSSSGIPWTCALDADVSTDEGPRHRTVIWTWAGARADAGADERLIVHEPDIAPWWRGSTSVAAGDAAVLALSAGRGLFQRLNRRRDTAPTIDVRSVIEIVDPLGIVSGDVEHRLVHWPPPPASAITSVFHRLDALVGDGARPVDAPPPSLVVRHEPGRPLTVSASWWHLPSWLEHQVDIGVAIAEAIVRRRG
jgi:hypothetical protein